MKRLLTLLLSTFLICGLNVAYSAETFGLASDIANARAAQAAAAQRAASMWCGYSSSATLNFNTNTPAATKERLAAVNAAIQRCQKASPPLLAQLNSWAQSCNDAAANPNATTYAACAIGYKCLSNSATGQPCFTPNLNNISCPANNNTFYNGSACASCPSNTPYLNPKSLVCQPAACTGTTPYYNQSAGACQACPSATPVFNANTQSCGACPSNMPVYQAATNTCTFEHWCGYDATATINWNATQFPARLQAINAAITRCKSINANPKLIAQLSNWANTCQMANMPNIANPFGTTTTVPQIQDHCRGAYVCLTNTANGQPCFVPNLNTQTCAAVSSLYNSSTQTCSTPILTPTNTVMSGIGGGTTGGTGSTGSTGSTGTTGTTVLVPPATTVTPSDTTTVTPSTTTTVTPSATTTVTPSATTTVTPSTTTTVTPSTTTTVTPSATTTVTPSATTTAPTVESTPVAAPAAPVAAPAAKSAGPTVASCTAAYPNLVTLQRNVAQLNMDLDNCHSGCNIQRVENLLAPMEKCCMILTGASDCSP